MRDLIDREAALNCFHSWVDKYGDVYTPDDMPEYQAIEALPSVQPEQHWIPCSEGLPEHGGRYLISVLDGINRRTTVSPYLPRCKAWSLTGRMAYWKVIAWMPLPEPYREVSE